MRRLIVISLLALAAACGLGRSTSPDATIIRVRLRDDAAKPGGRNQVLITLSAGPGIDAHTGDDGTADIRVAGAGTYQIRVVPRAGYLSTDALTRTIMVAENGTAVVDFVLTREGLPDLPPERGGY